MQFIQEPVVKPQDRFWEAALAKFDKKRLWIMRGTLVVAAIALAAGGIFYYRYRELRDNPLTPQEQIAQSNERLLADLGRLIALPTDEEPTIATVTDPEKLKDQAFFANARAGYKVVIYAKARKAILYDPMENKVVDIAPLNIDVP